MFKAMTFIVALTCCTASLAVQPPCLPAALALANAPVGVPVSDNTYWPTISNAPMRDGFAAFWYCKTNGDEIKVLEMHSTPRALARAGGFKVLQTRYLSNKDEALEALDNVGHTCVEASPDPHTLAKRSDCVSFLPAKGKVKQYLCLNPSVSEPHEAKLCKHLITEMVAHWPQ